MGRRRQRTARATAPHRRPLRYETLEDRRLLAITVDTLVDEADGKASRYQIVGEYEADMKRGMISITSPLARALIGKVAGDVATVVLPGGERNMEIVRVEYV